MIIEMESNRPEMKFFKRDLRSFYDHDPEEFALKMWIYKEKRLRRIKMNYLKANNKSLHFFQSCDFTLFSNFAFKYHKLRIMNDFI